MVIFSKRAINTRMPCHIANRNWTAVLKQAGNLHESVEANGSSRILILSKTLGDKDTMVHRKDNFFFFYFLRECIHYSSEAIHLV